MISIALSRIVIGYAWPGLLHIVSNVQKGTRGNYQDLSKCPSVVSCRMVGRPDNLTTQRSNDPMIASPLMVGLFALYVNLIYTIYTMQKQHMVRLRTTTYEKLRQLKIELIARLQNPELSYSALVDLLIESYETLAALDPEDKG